MNPTESLGIGIAIGIVAGGLLTMIGAFICMGGEDEKNPYAISYPYLAEARKIRQNTHDTPIMKQLGVLQASIDRIDIEIRLIHRAIEATREGKNPSEASEIRVNTKCEGCKI